MSYERSGGIIGEVAELSTNLTSLRINDDAHNEVRAAGHSPLALGCMCLVITPFILQQSHMF